MSERVLYEVAELDNPNGEPFAVLAVYPDRREGNGCAAVVMSLHECAAEAEQTATALRRPQ